MVRLIRRILVAVKDPATKKQPAVAKAAQIAAAFGAKIELFHVLTRTLYTDSAGTLASNPRLFKREYRASRLDQLERIAAPLLDRGMPISVAAEWDYPACDAIVRRAIAAKANLIVAQHHRGTRRLTWLLSYADWELLRLSPVPVLLVRSPRPYQRPAVLVTLDPLHASGKPSRLDSRIAGYGSLVAQGLHGTLHAVHAYPALPFGTVSADVAAEIERKAVAIAGTAFERELRSTSIPRSHRHLLRGDPATVIAKLARKLGCAIVVLGSVSRSGLERALIGNTAERLIDELRSDVLVIKPPHFPVHMPRMRSRLRIARPPVPMP